MKVSDLITQEVDIDVYDDVCEELGIAFCGPLVLTEAGRERFGEVLDYEVSLRTGTCYGDIAIVHVDDEDEEVWERRLKKAKEFFYAAAGYCANSNYEKWFEV